MVKQTDVKELDILLGNGIITNAEYAYLFSKIEKDKKNDFSQYDEESLLGKNILSFILTIIAIGAFVFGTCLLNLQILEPVEETMFVEYLGWLIFIIGLVFPIFLFGRMAHKTKNAGMKWAVILFSVFLIGLGVLILIASLR